MNAIKESFDNLPAAICIFSGRGLVRLMNRRMLAVGAMLLGSGIQTLSELRAALAQPPEGIAADPAMPGIYHFPDGGILRFSEKEITDRDGQRYMEVIASDVTALMAVRARLHRENQRLRALSDDMAEIVREEEILNMKIRVHDDIGHSLLSVWQAYWQCTELNELRALSEQRRTTIRLLHTASQEAPADAISYAKARARELGVEVRTVGAFPRDAAQALFSLAIRECASNCIRHAGGSRILAECRAAWCGGYPIRPRQRPWA